MSCWKNFEQAQLNFFKNFGNPIYYFIFSEFSLASVHLLRAPSNRFMRALARVAKEAKFHFWLLTSAWARKIKVTQSGRLIDLPQVDLFLILDWFISLERIQATKSRGQARATKVARGNQSVNFGAKNMMDISHFLCAPRAIVAKAENDFHQNVYECCSITHSAVCSRQTNGKSCSIE